MVIEIKNDVFMGNNFKPINLLIQIITHKDRYSLFIDFPVLEQNPLYLRLDDQDKDIIKKNFTRYIERSLTSNYIVSESQNGENVFNLEEAIHFFNKPVSVIVENSLNDSYFIKAILKYFDVDGKLKKHFDNHWLELENAGGNSNIPNFLNQKMNSLTHLPKSPKAYLRCFVLSDSDKEYPEEPIKPEVRRIIDFLVEHNISFHILNKRSMENYVPDDALDELVSQNSELSEWVSAYKNLAPKQKDFLDFSKGFRKKRQNGIPELSREAFSQNKPGVAENYLNVSDSDFTILDKGLKIPNYKANFPKAFQFDVVNRQNLLERMSHQSEPNELHDILHKISKLL